jgi:hypothetical protein
MMSKAVDRKLIDSWIKEAYPDGLYKLAQVSKIPANSLSKIRLGWVPRNPNKRQDLAKALGVKECQLFPVLPDKKEKAS